MVPSCIGFVKIGQEIEMKINPVAILFLVVCSMIGWLIGHTIDSAMYGFIISFAISIFATLVDK